MKTKLIGILIIMVFLTMMIGCDMMYANEEQSENTIINPLPEAANKINKNVTLYFRYANEDMLVGEQREIEIPVNERLERVVLNEIFEGPSNDSQELISVIPDTASVVSISESGEFLFVTLSNEFISDSKVANVDPLNEETYEQAKKEMELAIYSIANTLIELGSYSKIQLLVDMDKSGRGERIKLEDIGFDDGGGYSLEPIGWNGSLVLNTENTVELLLETMSERDFNDLYSLIAYYDSNLSTAPHKDAFINQMSTLQSTLEEYSLLDSKVSSDGSSAIVAINIVLKNKNGLSVSKDNIILRLKREKNLWKIEYSSFEEVFIIN